MSEYVTTKSKIFIIASDKFWQLIAIFIAGIFFVTIALFFSNNILIAIFISIGTSLIASSLFSLTSFYHKSKTSQICDHLYKEWGIIHAYEKRSEITTSCISLLKSSPSKIDVSAIRLRAFIDTHKETLTSLLKTGKTHIRLLLPNPKSPYATAFQTLLKDNVLTKESLDSVKDWINNIPLDIRQRSLEIRYTDSVMTSMYQRIDNTIFMGPYINQTKSQDTFTLQCTVQGLLGQTLVNRFKEDFDLAKPEPSVNPFIIEFIGMPGSGKTSCATTVMEKYPSMVYFTTEGIPSSKKDSPLTFNKRVSSFLRQYVKRLEQGECLLLDRGTVDAKIWLQVHTNKNSFNDINTYEKLLGALPHIPMEVPHYKFLFLTDPEICMKRRTILRSRPDEWALEHDMLTQLYAAYKELESSDDKPLIVMDTSNKDLDEVIAAVLVKIDNIVREHTPEPL